MKKIFVFIGLCLSITACNSGKSGGSSGSDSTVAVPEATQTTADTAGSKATPPSKGAELLAKNDCLTCHKVDIKLVGPAYADVAKKYTASPAVIDTLANKIIKGGKGNWGEIPMTPHPTLAMADAQEMVKYILSLKK